MAQGALRSHRRDSSGAVEPAGDSDNRIELEQRKRRCRVIQVDFPCFDLSFQLLGQCVLVHFQADCEGSLRADAWPDAAVFLAGNGLVQPQGIAEKSLRTEGIE